RHPDRLRLAEMGKTVEGRAIPLAILADPPVASAAEAAKSGKLVLFAMGNIHAGEVAGKEALLMLAREWLGARDSILKEAVVVFAPIFNADGNERIDKKNRPWQNGPSQGVGVRPNAAGQDLNRDFIKLETPEVRALVRTLNAWNPAVFMDLHDTNGSFHRYALTYDGPRHPAGDPAIQRYVNETLLPATTEDVMKRTGYDTFFYGDFNRDNTKWESYPAVPRYGIQYLALRPCLPILAEAYVYSPFKDRVLSTKAFVESVLRRCVADQAGIRKMLAASNEEIERRGRAPRIDDRPALNYEPVPRGVREPVKGFVEEIKDGKRKSTGKPKDHLAEVYLRHRVTADVARPYAYLLAANQTAAIENLQRHGLVVEELREDVTLDVEAYAIEDFKRAERAFQNHKNATARVSLKPAARMVEAGMIVVRTGQPLGRLATQLLEPASPDGLLTWNYFDESIESDHGVPVMRLPKFAPLLVTAARPLPEDRKERHFDFETVYGGERRLALDGDPATDIEWLPDGEHFVQNKGGAFYFVHAQSGRARPAQDSDAVVKALGAIPSIGPEAAKTLASSFRRIASPARDGNLYEFENDLYYCSTDGKNAFRVTSSPAREEEAQYSPDGKFIAFVREQNLYVADLATRTERALTADGGGPILNGKPSWVYWEEIYDRRPQSFWWSPDSRQLAFLRFDETGMQKFTVIDELPTHQRLEQTAYPKVGDLNPRVRLGAVSVGGGAPRWLDVASDADRAPIFSRVGWKPDGEVWFTVQDRYQTWSDLYFAKAGATPRRIFRETNKAWVRYDISPSFLKDGSFLYPSERTGYQHLYLYAADGTLKRPLTTGEWEVRRLQRVDEAAGFVYFSGMKDNPIGEKSYRAKLDGGGVETVGGRGVAGDHRGSIFAPKGDLFLDVWSDHKAPTKVVLRRGDGAAVRTVDSNPVHLVSQFKFAPFEFLKIPTPDGFTLEATIVRPKNFDPAKKYPVWFKTYGGPHMPSITDRWNGGRSDDQFLASNGFVVFGCDPRSASGKGAVSSWTAYKQLGVQETKDVETAIAWLLKNHPYCDASRIGMEGHSYGGYLTSYCMTHTKLFAAGIAGAPVTDWANYDSIYTERYML
ncbi:MAG TPA: DPP IV N-terminal domain-containing protein, partial [Planctomycetia bacterium]|nr:DPP IV N-terminal domain-containing protein [Planctomycetia bacterium]